VKLHFKTKKLKNALTTDAGLAKTYSTLAKKIKQRIQQLEAADNLDTIRQISVLRLHQHIGNNKGIWSIDIQENWRILFTLGNDPIPYTQDGGVNIKEINIIRIESVNDPH